MPLDTGAFVEEPAGGQAPLVKRPRLVLDSTVDIGSALKGARESLGLTLEDIAETTKVRARHLAAIEAAALDQLPSRPFTVGYVRAYAKALNLDADATASRFRTEHPSPDDDLHTPVGVRHNRAGRSRALMGLGAAALVAVVGWNIAVRAMAPSPHKAPSASRAIIAAAHTNAAVDGPYSVNAPLPAPPEATAPAPYVTPIVSSGAAATNAAAAPAAAEGAPTPFVAGGKIYGPVTGASNLIIQAKKSISLEIHGPGNAIYYAGQLAAGESYRVPALPNLVADVSNPASAELYRDGMSVGPLTAPQMPLKTAG